MVAPRFFANLCQALAEAPGRVEDRALVAWFGQAGLRPDASFAWDVLDAPLRELTVEPDVRATSAHALRSASATCAAAPH